jgi:hypothetical protein
MPTIIHVSTNVTENAFVSVVKYYKINSCAYIFGEGASYMISVLWNMPTQVFVDIAVSILLVTWGVGSSYVDSTDRCEIYMRTDRTVPKSLTLQMKTSIFTETFGNLQHSAWHIPASWSHIFQDKRRRKERKGKGDQEWTNEAKVTSLRPEGRIRPAMASYPTLETAVNISW